MRRGAKYVCVAVIVPALVYAVYSRHYEGAAQTIAADTLLLLLPDGTDVSTPAVSEWLDAANEEGLHLAPVHDSEFLNPLTRIRGAGLIVPDQLHRSANDALVGELYRYVRNGGNLMVVYDACTWDLNGRFPHGDSRLSSLVGVHYALYDRFGKQTMESAQVTGTADVMRELGVPPGNFVPVDGREKLARWRPVSEHESTARFAFSRYHYGDVEYPMFRTVGEFDGTVLLQTQRAVVAGYRMDAAGQVLFVNLPLGYLVGRTDGLLLHSFLRFFAVHMIGLPYLAAVPDGIGGLVFNWHIDALSALTPLKKLAAAGVFDRGRFSVHVTAGPDVDVFGDGRGLDVAHDSEAQHWIHYLIARGHELGSHGGWIHNYFGDHVNESNEGEFQQYLEMNKDALERVSGTRMTEYSAPIGNHPEWVTRWLERHGFIAYYFSGDAGMGPTQVYRDAQRDGPQIWAFPILHMGKEASLEEMGFDNIPAATARDWLIAATDFAAREHVARLVYSHPVGAERFIGALQSWLDRADDLQRQGMFRWYTMSGLAEFLNRRKSVHWTVVKRDSTTLALHASDPKTLVDEAWVFPQEHYRDVRVTEGVATVRSEDGMIFVTAGNCRQLTIEVTHSREPKVLKAETLEAKP